MTRRKTTDKSGANDLLESGKEKDTSFNEGVSASNLVFQDAIDMGVSLPTGRPYRRTSHSDSNEASTFKVADIRNYGLPSYMCIYTAIDDFLELAAGTDNAKESPAWEWATFTTQRLYTSMRRENRSNVGYSAAQLREYLMAVSWLYASSVSAITHMSCVNMSDANIPALSSMLTHNVTPTATAVAPALRIFPVSQDFNPGHIDQTPGWITNIQASWTQAMRLTSLMEQLPIPTRIKHVIDTLYGRLYTDENRGGMYYRFVARPNNGNVEAVDESIFGFNLSEVDLNRLNFAEHLEIGNSVGHTPFLVLSALATALLNKSSVYSTMIADLRRVRGMVNCSIAIPSDFTAQPEVVLLNNSIKDLINNTTYINFEGFWSSGVAPEGAVAPMVSPSSAEIRVNMDADMSNANDVASATLLTHVATRSAGLTGMDSPVPIRPMSYFVSIPSGTDGDYPTATTQLTIPSYFTTSLEHIDDRWLYYFFNQFSALQDHPVIPILSSYENSDQYGNNDFMVLSKVTEGTRVSVDALQNIQYSAWASLYRVG